MQGNIGTDGGGLVLCDRSYMYLTPYTNITFDSNHAWHTGGAIYTEVECLQSIPLCFFGRLQSLDWTHWTGLTGLDSWT